MSTTLAPQGLVPTSHPSGIIRVDNLVDGILSSFGTSIFTGTPIKRDTNGTIIPCASGVDVCIGVFQGCEFSSATKRFVVPYWPAGQTYDAGSMIAKYTSDKEITYEGQASGPVAQVSMGEGINLLNASQGSVFTGFSTQALNATVTGSTLATFQITGLAPYDDNAWGDAFTKLRVRISNYQGQVA
jgi:hypothetical protein